MDLEQARKILEVKTGAGPKEIIEARDDLFFLWDPSRLSERPGLRARAAQRREEIQQAYEVLMADLPTSGRIGETAGAARASSSRSASRPDAQRGPSLYDEVFSGRETRRKAANRALWIGAVLVPVAIGLFLWLTPGGTSEQLIPPPRVDDPAAPTVPDQEPEAGVTSQVPPESAEQVVSSETATSGQAVGQGVAGQEVAPSPRPTSVPAPVRETAPKPESTAPSKPNPGPSDQRPALIRDESALQDPEAAAAAARQAEAEAIAQESMRLLLQKSGVARMLVEGQMEGLPVQGWRVLQRKGDEVWLAVTGGPIEGTSIEFVWAVDLKGASVRPLSQAARDLESKFARP